MSDDASYMSFLEKANADTGGSREQSTSTSEARTKFDPTKTSTEALPASLKSLPDVTYTSDADFPFEPVTFNYSGSGLPSIAEFQKCLRGQDNVEELSPEEFDPQNQYKDIIDRVKQAGKGGVTVFRVQTSKTRVEYYILTVGERMLVGVVAKAVES